MTIARSVFNELNSKADLERIFAEICEDVDEANSRPELTELYRRAAYLITLAHAPVWDQRLGEQTKAFRDLSREKFKRIAFRINQRAEEIGTEADYPAEWDH